MQEPKTLNIAEFGVRADTGGDSVPGLLLALDAVRRTGAKRLVFPAGRYDFRADRATERYLFVSNNDEGLKRIAFPLLDIHDLEIDGQGSRFFFHGFMSPFVLEKSSNITLKNFSIDWTRTFHTEGTIIAVHDDSFEVSFTAAFRHRVVNQVLECIDNDGDGRPYNTMLEFDPVRRETAFMAEDYYMWPATSIHAEDLAPGTVRIFRASVKATVGNVMVFGAAQRLCPAFTISDSSDVRLENVAIHHCGGMGVIAQRSRNIELERVRVTPTPDSGRVVSITADATHFVNCSGRIVMNECLFECQKDDATNIHGIYAKVSKVLQPDGIEIHIRHHQQHGFELARPGTTLELVRGANLTTYGHAVVKSVERINKAYTRLTLESPLPKDLVEGDVVADANANPDVLIRNCVIRNNRARGLLLGARGKIVIEDNTFHVPGAAILLEGDGCHWFEQAGVRDLTIRRNRFENCNYGIWGRACIEITPGIGPESRATSRYNRNIKIEGNTFRVFDPRLLRGHCVDGLVFRNNAVETSNDYPAPAGEHKAFDLEHCDHVLIEVGHGQEPT